jgi:hypothetical protein
MVQFIKGRKKIWMSDDSTQASNLTVQRIWSGLIDQGLVSSVGSFPAWPGMLP